MRISNNFIWIDLTILVWKCHDLNEIFLTLLAWSGAFLTFWSECKNLTKLSEIPQMAFLNSDKNVGISDNFVWNDYEIWLEY